MTSKKRDLAADGTCDGGGKGLRERRCDARYDLKGRALFQWRRPRNREVQQGEGVTRNVSRSGAFIESAAVPPVGAELKVTVELSGGQGTPFQTRLSGRGTVRRIERNHRQPNGFGAWVAFSTERPGQTSPRH